MSPTSIFASASTPADAIVDLSYFVVAAAAGILVAVAGLLVCAVVQFRKETDDDHSEPAQVYGSNEVEIAWTVIPILIVIVLFLATAVASQAFSEAASNAGTRHVPGCAGVTARSGARSDAGPGRPCRSVDAGRAFAFSTVDLARP